MTSDEKRDTIRSEMETITELDCGTTCDECGTLLLPGMWPYCHGDAKQHIGKPAYGWHFR